MRPTEAWLPIDFCLTHLQGSDKKVTRLHNALLSVREEIGWDPPKAKGVDRGVVLTDRYSSMAAAVIEVKVETGQLQVIKVTWAADPGIVLNPEGARTQAEGCVMIGIGAALYEETQVVDGQFSACNFHQDLLTTTITIRWHDST